MNDGLDNLNNRKHLSLRQIWGDAGGENVSPRGFSPSSRIRSWLGGGTPHGESLRNKEDTTGTKKYFYQEMQKSYGAANAKAGVESAFGGFFLRKNACEKWLENSKPLTQKDINKITRGAESSSESVKNETYRRFAGGWERGRNDGLMHKAYKKFVAQAGSRDEVMPYVLQLKAIDVLGSSPEFGKNIPGEDDVFKLLEPVFKGNLKPIISGDSTKKSGELLEHILGMRNFIASPDSRLVLNLGERLTAGLEARNLSFASRIKAFFSRGGSFWYGTRNDQKENCDTKMALHEALVDRYGEDFTKTLYEKARLNEGWTTDQKPMTAKVAEVVREFCRAQDLAAERILTSYINLGMAVRWSELVNNPALRVRFEGGFSDVQILVENEVKLNSKWRAMNWDAIDNVAWHVIRNHPETRLAGTHGDTR